MFLEVLLGRHIGGLRILKILMAKKDVVGRYLSQIGPREIFARYQKRIPFTPLMILKKKFQIKSIAVHQ